MEIKNRQKLLLIIAVSGLALLAADSAIISPAMASWNARRDQIAKLTKDVAEGERKVKGKATYLGAWERMRTNSFSTEVTVAQNDMLKALERWERSSGIKVDRIAPQMKTAEDYSTLECRVDANGDAYTLERFLEQIERDSLGVKIESIEISARDNDGRALSLGIQLSGLILSTNPQQ